MCKTERDILRLFGVVLSSLLSFLIYPIKRRTVTYYISAKVTFLFFQGAQFTTLIKMDYCDDDDVTLLVLRVCLCAVDTEKMCCQDWRKFGSSCYYISTEEKTW